MFPTGFTPRPSPLPLAYRLWEGATTSAMPLGHLLAGGLASTHLFGIYVVHSVASLAYHLFPCRETYWTDTSLINLLLMERVYRKTAHPAVYGVGLLSMVLEPVKSHTWVAARSAVAAYVGVMWRVV